MVEIDTAVGAAADAAPEFAVQHHLIPGRDLHERFANARAYGFQGVELTAWGFSASLPECAIEIEQAMRASGLRISALCTHRPDDFVHPDAAERKHRLDRLVELLLLADRLGASGVIVVPVRSPQRMPDLSPVLTEHEAASRLTVAMIEQALERTPDGRARVLLEPLNRYEAWFLNRIEQAATLCRGLSHPRLGVLADLYHMNIEETSITGVLHDERTAIGYLHLADSNRQLPGHGHTDFASVFQMLRSNRYEGWMSLECSVGQDAARSLPETVRRLQSWWSGA